MTLLKLNIRNIGHQFFIDDMLVLKIVDSGQQSYNYIVNATDGKQQLYQLLNDDSSTRNRIDILQRIQNIKNITRMINCNNVMIDVSKLNDVSKYKFRITTSRAMTLIVYEFVPYKTIDQHIFLQSKSNNLNEVQVGKCVRLIYKLLQVASDLKKLNIYHLDIKPENILVTDEELLLIDFGSAVHIEDSEIPVSCVFDQDDKMCRATNTTAAFSPQQYEAVDGYISCSKFVSYSIGRVMYHVLTGYNIWKPLEPDSAECRHLYKYHLLVVDLVCTLAISTQAFRLTIDQALEHPVFRKYADPRVVKLDNFLIVTEEEQLQLRHFYFNVGLQLHKNIVQGPIRIRRNSISGPLKRKRSKLSKDDINIDQIKKIVQFISPVDAVLAPHLSALRIPVFTAYQDFNQHLTGYMYLGASRDHFERLLDLLWGSKINHQFVTLVSLQQLLKDDSSLSSQIGFVVQTKKSRSQNVNEITGRELDSDSLMVIDGLIEESLAQVMSIDLSSDQEDTQ